MTQHDTRLDGGGEAGGTQLAGRLLEVLRGIGPCMVAFSGGVDSAVVAKAATLTQGAGAVAVTGVGAALAAGELEQAEALAAEIGIKHATLATEEIASASYVANGPDRCFYCKSELYARLTRYAAEHGYAVVVNGANTDDCGDHRPGMAAAERAEVRSPLIEAGLNKAAVRRLAASWRLPVATKPATPCLASRVAYGVSVTPERLARIDLAEQMLRSLGLEEVRVRLHPDDIARIEAPCSAIARLVAEPTRQKVAARLRELGFRFVTIDLEGFRSGSLNVLVPSEQLTRGKPAR